MAMQNVEIGMVWGLGVTQSHRQCHHSREWIRLPIQHRRQSKIFGGLAPLAPDKRCLCYGRYSVRCMAVRCLQHIHYKHLVAPPPIYTNWGVQKKFFARSAREFQICTPHHEIRVGAPAPLTSSVPRPKFTPKTAILLRRSPPPSNLPIPQAIPLTTLNGIRIQSAVLPRYTFQTDAQTNKQTDTWDTLY